MKDEVFAFAQPWFLLLLLLLPVLSWLQAGRRAAPSIRFSSLEGLRKLGRKIKGGAGGFGGHFLLFTLALFIVALARPRLGQTTNQVEASGVDIVLALDVSGSMYARDFTLGGEKADRLEVVKDVTKKFILARPNDRIGLVCFAGRPYRVSPLTLDHDWLLKNLERVQIGLVEDGTAIGSAIVSASNRIKDNPAKSKIVVLLTDGEETVTTVPPLTAAEGAAKLGIKIYTIAAGTRGLADVPTRKDFFGNFIYEKREVKVDEAMLKNIADVAGGKFYRATDTASLTEIFGDIDKLEKTEIKLQHFTTWRDLFPWLVGAGLGLGALVLILNMTIWRMLP